MQRKMAIYCDRSTHCHGLFGVSGRSHKTFAVRGSYGKRSYVIDQIVFFSHNQKGVLLSIDDDESNEDPAKRQRTVAATLYMDTRSRICMVRVVILEGLFSYGVAAKDLGLSTW